VVPRQEIENDHGEILSQQGTLALLLSCFLASHTIK
jgi:hypothetical protein